MGVMARNGIPAAAVLAGGISRHGSSCSCPYCSPRTADQRQAIPIVRAAGVVQPPVKLADVATGPAAPRTFDEMFAAARASVARLEAERDARELVSVGGAWSPSHHVRRAS